MGRRKVKPVRFVLIGVLMLAPTALLLFNMALARVLDVGLALACFAIVAVIAGLVLRMLFHDSRALVQQLDRMAIEQTVISPPFLNSATAYTLLGAMNRAHQAWIERLEETELRVSAGESVVEALHDPLILLDSGRRVLRANQAARGLFGERMLDRDLAVTLRNPVALEAVDAVLTGAASRTVEFMLPVPVERALEARVKPFNRPVPSVNGVETIERGVLLTLHDVTLLKRSEQMRADFVANASHELRTPLSTLVGFIETIRGPARDDDEARDRFLAIMHDQAGRMTRLVSDLLSLSRIEMDEHTPPTTQADVAELVRRVAAALELKAAGRRMRIRIEGEGELPPVLGDEDQLAQVFQNLIDNALKYGREQTDVTVRLAVHEPGPVAIPVSGTPAPGLAMAALPVLPGRRRPVRSVTIAVTDRGEGIPRTHLPRLTERFYRVDPARSRAMGGTGLGLAIVKHIVNRHRGRLTIDSEVGKGSTFTVFLPSAPDRQTSAGGGNPVAAVPQQVASG
jgi:two-component system, OmpR family, phosphate regulon sensor histidine kinase PhoR